MFHGACIDPTSCEVCLVAELVQGAQVDAFICPPPMIPSKRGRHRIVLDVGNALRYLHALEPPIIHGDLKPANVMVERWASGLRAKVLDFGLARMQTKNAMPLGGTLQWKAPEVLHKRGSALPAPSADVFSFGLFAYFVVTGLKPFPDMPQSAIKHLRVRGHNMPTTWPEGADLCEECRALCRDCVRSEAHLRPSMGGVQMRVSQWLAPPGGTSARREQAAAVSWDEQVRRLRQSIGKKPPKVQHAPEPEQEHMLIHPNFQPTREISKRLTVSFAIDQWNIPLRGSACCSWHARLLEAAAVIKRLQKQQCTASTPADTQCPQCGLLDVPTAAECNVCTWMASMAPDRLEALAEGTRPRGRRQSPAPRSELRMSL